MRVAFAAAVLLLACDSGGSTFDGGSDGTTGTLQCDGGCTTTIAVYCQANPCPASPAEAIASYCDGGGPIKVYTGCGHTTVIRYGIDTSEEILFDADGGLLVIYDTNPFATCCVAGPPGFEAPSLQGCTLSLTSCPAADAGDAGDAGAD